MNLCAVLKLGTVLFALAADGCSGYSDGSGSPVSDPTIDRARVSAAAPIASRPPQSKPEDDAGSMRDAPQPSGLESTIDEQPSAPMDASEPPMELDASQVMDLDTGGDADLRLARSPSFDGYITDGAGEPLYMFIGDVTGSFETGCVSACASAWPPFDVEIARTTADLELAQVSRFHRQDGAWQTTFNGHPLYRRATEAGERDVTSDGVDGRWFVARNYLVFMSSARTFTPAGGMGPNRPFLTDRRGRTLYVCIDDQPAAGLIDPISSCDAACLDERPVFGPSNDAQAEPLPSVLEPSELRVYVRSNGMKQFTYRGWPLHYFSGDAVAGATEGHNDGAWRAFDPVAFGLN